MIIFYLKNIAIKYIKTKENKLKYQNFIQINMN